MQLGMKKIAIFYQYLALSRKRYKVGPQLPRNANRRLLCDLSNSIISNDLELPLTNILKTRHYLTLNISETVRDRDVFTMKH